MTIRTGEPWGTTGPVPEGSVVVRSNIELHRLVNDHRTANLPLPPVALLGGDLLRALGGTGSEERLTGDVAIVPIDLTRITIGDGTTGWFAAHLVARRSWWRGPIWTALNGQFIGPWDVAPRAHPNDGRIDLVHVDRSMSGRDRWRARRRLVQGNHLPHPAIEVRQVREAEVDLGRETRIVLDGERWAVAPAFHLVVEPDALVVAF